ncbi:MAG TPA: nucleotide sugar dehydrogenase [Syntrophales bacterium]|nr:nucleotide sugar dehydrogenase [Syntrophales bacterium]HOS77997.1 nucleotide sugar dehydrogenase [Syntrophales bacterium]
MTHPETAGAEAPLSLATLAARTHRLAVVGLGYVGLPLAVQMARHFDVVGFDIRPERIAELKAGRDRTLEVAPDALKAVAIAFSSDPAVLKTCRLIIVAVPTPIDEARRPDLRPVEQACVLVGRNLARGTCVVFESTVYPGVTEEVCVPLLSRESGLSLGEGFTVGYSPERINPGDRVHTLESITKIVSGSDAATLKLLNDVYGRVVRAGIHPAASIKIAEAAKVIENTQRDINIALMNELAIIFQRMGIDTLDVLAAAGTKWNFLPFRPGLVGGHCIGVDPYYLTYKAEMLGYHPEMILAGRRINDNMGKYVAERTIKLLIGAGTQIREATVAVLGLTFKEDVPDLRNTRVIDIIRELQDYGIRTVVHDPLADPDEVERYFGLTLHDLKDIGPVDAVIVAVAHASYRRLALADIAGLCRSGDPVLVDIKGMFPAAEARAQGFRYWRL